MSDKTPVRPEAYDERWLDSAWGARANDRLLSGETLRARPRLERALALADLKPGQTLLDIACGRGELPVLAAKRGVYTVGLDFSSASLAFARQLRASHRPHMPAGADMQLVRADACRLPFANSSFDRVTLLDIIEHLVPAQLESMLHEVARLLRPGGYAILHTLPNRWVYEITFPLLNRMTRRFPKDPRGPIDRTIHVNEQDLPRLHRTLDRCGLKHRLWLEQHMAAQARWNRSLDLYGDTRDRVYPILAGRAGRLLELASRTPLKLLLANDIFGIAWKGAKAPVLRTPLALTEWLACRLLPDKR